MAFAPKRILGLLSLAMAGLLLASTGYAEHKADESGGYRTPAYMAGVHAYRHGDYAHAVQFFKQALAQDAANSNAHYYLALSLDHLGSTQEAASEYAYVISHTKEAKLVAYAHSRLSLLAPASSVKTGTQSPQLAMIAAGSQGGPPVLYRGSVSQIAVPLKNSKNALIVDATVTPG